MQLLPEDVINIPTFAYAVTASMFLPTFQSFLYNKVCLTTFDVSYCANDTAARDAGIHKSTNAIMLAASVCMGFFGIFSSYYVGQLGDRKSRRLALLFPYIGILLADLTLIAQTCFVQLSPYWFVVSEVIFGCFGGYMSIISASFAYLTSLDGLKKKSSKIARMEGVIGLGGVVGYLLSSQIQYFGYFNISLFFFCSHLFCAVFIYFMRDIRPSAEASARDLEELIITNKSMMNSSNIILLLVTFAASFFAFVGSAHVLFFYLKVKFLWDAKWYGYLRTISQTLSTIMALFIYPWLKSKGVRDTSLAIGGLLARSAGKAWMALVWSPGSVFLVVVFDMFSRIPASALRSLIASNVDQNQRGCAYSIVGVMEAICNILAALVFHSLFPWSMKTLPQLSFILMSVIILPPTFLLWRRRFSIESPQDS